LRVTYEAQGVQPSIARAFAKFQGPGTYVTTVTQPAHFRRYLVDQLSYLVKGLCRHHKGGRFGSGNTIPLCA
jgi:AMP nucleosidase